MEGIIKAAAVTEAFKITAGFASDFSQICVELESDAYELVFNLSIFFIKNLFQPLTSISRLFLAS